MNSLQSEWIYWAHSPTDTVWTIQSYKSIMNVKYVEELISLLHVLPEKMLTSYMFFIMKNNILPLWEDKNNINGGCFSYKVSNKYVKEVWTTLAYAMCGNTITTDPEFNRSIAGMTISPKKSFCIIKLWMTNCIHQNPNKIIMIQNLNHKECFFKKHGT